MMITQNEKFKTQNNDSKFKTDLKARCFQLSLTVIALSDTLPNKRSAWVIIDQLIRSICSIGANLIEARGASSRLEFKRFNEISLKSAYESKYWLELLRESKLAPSYKIDPILNELEEITKMIARGILNLKGGY